MTTWVTDFSSNQSVGSERWLPGFLWAVLIHLVLILLFMPTIEHSPPAAPVRITVQVSQLEPMVEEEVVEPEPPPELVVPVKPLETKKKILIAKDDTPPEPDDMVVIEQPPEVEPVEEKKPEPKKVEPKPEPKKVEKPKLKPEPKKVEKPKPKPEKPKKVEKPKQEKPVVKPKVVEKVEPIETPTEVVEAPSTDTSAQPSTSAVASSENSSNSNATGSGSNPDEKNQGGTADVDRNTAWKGYGQLLYAMVSKNKNYPQLAIRRHLEGTVMVSVRFEKGRMVGISVVGQGSGHTVLDKAAHEMVEKAVKALPVRGNLSGKSFSVVVPVNFRLTD